ncbi:hypothetical protein FOZ63_021548 [Perkinsus olseni]|uniref:Peptidase C1A papain C-terminal domain-containing protein n=1 Tax=Perkinsus olseni TaxID=32597 RepID=A0A7J6Q3B7_PEROL|nr:hypothetical protein FOZ63_021548 [Perkinsus olseni]
MKKSDGCWPYDFKPCAHHVKESDYQACPTVRAAVTANCHETSRDFCQDTYSTPSCSSSCHNKQYGTPFDQDRYYTDDYFPSRFGDPSSIKQEIMTNGPVSAAFSVYEDFTSYKSGVYKHTTGSLLGGHAVEIIGWGTENGTPFWLVKNSWNDEWGDGGFFKIAQGDCGIDDMILGSTPKV